MNQLTKQQQDRIRVFGMKATQIRREEFNKTDMFKDIDSADGHGAQFLYIAIHNLLLVVWAFSMYGVKSEYARSKAKVAMDHIGFFLQEGDQ
jgi:hypothetical protein